VLGIEPERLLCWSARKIRELDLVRLVGIEPESELKLKLSLNNLVEFARLGGI
jgi:hypothetical protein